MNVETKKLVSINEDEDRVLSVAIMWIDKNRRFFLGMLNLPLLKSPYIVLGDVRWSNILII